MIGVTVVTNFEVPRAKSFPLLKIHIYFSLILLVILISSSPICVPRSVCHLLLPDFPHFFILEHVSFIRLLVYFVFLHFVLGFDLTNQAAPSFSLISQHCSLARTMHDIVSRHFNLGFSFVGCAYRSWKLSFCYPTHQKVRYLMWLYKFIHNPLSFMMNCFHVEPLWC